MAGFYCAQCNIETSSKRCDLCGDFTESLVVDDHTGMPYASDELDFAPEMSDFRGDEAYY